MGCDIHQRVFLWSKVVNRYIAPSEVTEYINRYEIVHDRYYDLFGLFGNTIRSNYPMLDALNDGFPEHLVPETTKMVFNVHDNFYHTFSWAFLPDLYQSFKRYAICLRNPAKFVIEDPESIESKFFDLPEWKEDTTSLITAVDQIVNKLGYIVNDYEYDNLIDKDKTLFLFYFDN